MMKLEDRFWFRKTITKFAGMNIQNTVYNVLGLMLLSFLHFLHLKAK